jgi:GNAT superfamily N-acetyltransferase
MREYLAHENPAGRIFMCKCPDNQPDSIRFILQRGFQQMGHDLHSELDVTEFDAARFAQAERRLQEQGIEIVSYHEVVARDLDFLRKFYDLTCLTMQDMPAGGTRTFPPFEHFTRSVIQHPTFLPDMFFMALDNGRYVGQSDLADEKQDREHLGTGYTGVHPDYRRRGIATVLKARCIQRAQELGVKTIATGNDSTNPMYQLNLQLGFKPVPGDLLFEMRLA